MDQIINHAVLSLDFWQDTVTYEGCTMPIGTIGFLSKSWQPSFPKNNHVSFVGMFRSDLFEGLCVGHAPKKCLICGRWFLTLDARHTKYCGGLAPSDRRGRTCRQIGNLRDWEQRELADNHLSKAIYPRRMNTILQSIRRGMLDAEVAAAMKKLAKDKMLRALSDYCYASTAYAQEMTQEALLETVQKK